MKVVVVAGLLLTCLAVTGLRHPSKHVKNKFSSEENTYDDVYENVEEQLKSITVCKTDKSDQCKCNTDKGIIDCRKSGTVNGKIRGSVVKTFTTALIKPEDSTFVAKYVILAGHTITYLDTKTLIPGEEKSIESFDFTNNQIRLINENSFNRFTKLEKLRLSHNLLTLDSTSDGWITDKLGDSLKKLYLDYNMLGTINDGVFDPLHNLETLVLDGNPHLKLSDKTFGSELKNLKALSLDRCSLESLPDKVFDKLDKLESISLIGNSFTAIPSPIAKLSTLTYVDLSKTDLTEITTNAFERNDKLLYIYLKELKYLSVVDNCAFCGLTSLKRLVMSRNPQLYHINKNAFGFDTKETKRPLNLEALIIDNNNISTLNENLLNWKKLDQLALGGNPLKCDGNLNWLIKDKTLHLTGDEVPKCAYPLNLKGTSIQKLTAEQIPDAPPSSDGSSSSMFGSVLAVMLTLIVLGGVGFVGYIVCSRSRPNPFYRPTMPNVGFSNLSHEIDMEEDVLSLGEDAVDIDMNKPAAV